MSRESWAIFGNWSTARKDTVTSLAFRFRDKAGRITFRTFNDLRDDVDSLGTAMIVAKHEGHEDLLSAVKTVMNGACVCYFAIVNGTGVAVPLDRHLPKNEIENLTARGK